MRYLILIISCFSTTITYGQSLLFANDSAYVRMIDLPDKEPFDTAHAYNRVKESYLYIISEKDLYDLFGYERATSMRGFNFAEQHILGQMICTFCFLHCKHGIEKDGTNCHRNRCSYAWKWTVRDNQKAFALVPASVLPGHNNDLFTKNQFRDTMLINDESQARWYTSGGGDCHAKHVYELYSDKFYPNLLLKEFNHYGGCRAGGLFPFTILFTMPAGYWNKVKRTILVDKYK